jgi:D-alanyl-D-alanine carboxypeptidase
MGKQGKHISKLVIFTGLALNLVMLWGVLQLWPGPETSSPNPGLKRATRKQIRPKTATRPVPAPGLAAGSESPPPVASLTAGDVVIKSSPLPTITGGPPKISRTIAASAERVTIDGENFTVPPPWQGHRLPRVIDPLHPGLVMLPREVTFEARKIYVTAQTQQAFLKMAEAAARDGVRLQVDSGYRSAGYQRAIYRRRLAEGVGFSQISKSVAPPGYSEHMLGCALDLVPSNWSFKDTPADHWLQANAWRFSFVQTYPANDPRGFSWEPWHWKYIGGEAKGSGGGVHLKDQQS